jgi:hypothetical protein
MRWHLLATYFKGLGLNPSSSCAVATSQIRDAVPAVACQGRGRCVICGRSQ